MTQTKVSADGPDGEGAPDPYAGKWLTLSNTTLGMLMVVINQSIILIALPDIFRGIRLNPLTPGNSSYFLWLLMGFSVVTSVLVVSFGRLGDMFGRVRMYNLGFAVFSVFSILLAVTWLQGSAGALWLIIMRVGQGVGGALLFANSSAILTDAFPQDQRGLALGVNQVAAIGGSFIGLVLGGLLGPVGWRYVFLVSVPFGIFGTVWAYLKLVERGVRTPSKIDWWGNLTFAVGLIALLVGITYGIEPYGGHSMGWTSPWVIGLIAGGIVVLIVFGYIETKVANPMFRLPLFRIRAFAAGNLASLLAALGRGGMMFILIIWLQGIWLPQHGYNFTQTPLWAGIYMLPLTAGFLIAGPISGILSDHFGARPFATGGMVAAAVSFGLLELLPANFSYIWFALLLLLNGLAMGLFSSPNRAGIMNSLPPNQRGAGSGMTATFQNSAMVLSIGIFFTLIIAGLASGLPGTLYHGLVAQGVPAKAAAGISHLPPTGALFAAFLGYNPMSQLLGPVLGHLPHAQAAYLTGRSFFPHLVSQPFMHGLREAFDFAVAACVVAAVASWLRGGKYHYVEGAELAGAAPASQAGYGGIQPVSAPADDLARDADSGSADGQLPAHTAVASPSRSGDPEHAPTPAPGGSNATVAAAEAGATRCAAFAGTVLAKQGTPLSGATVTVMDRRGLQTARAATATDGHFELAVPSGSYTALVSSPGYRPVATALAVNGTSPHGEFILTGIGTISGSVVEATSGVPVADAEVSVTDAAGDVVGRARTAADGRFTFPNQEQGHYSLQASAEHHLVEVAAAEVEPGATVTIDLALTATASLAGTVSQAATRAPLAGMIVTLSDDLGQVVAQSVTATDGSYRFSDLPEGLYSLVASGFGPAAVAVELSGGGERRYELALGDNAD